MRQKLARGTWLDPEAYAYPAGSLRQSRRHFRAVCPDGKVRTGVCGIPDTYFSIPARVWVYGKTVTGFVTTKTASGLDTPTENDPAFYVFVPYKYGKNGNVFNWAEREAMRLNVWSKTLAGRGTAMGRALVGLTTVKSRAPYLGR